MHQGMQTPLEAGKGKKMDSLLCDSMDYTVHGILQASILEWVRCHDPEAT